MSGVKKPWYATIRRIAPSLLYERDETGAMVMTHPHISICTQITEGPTKEEARLVFIRLTADEFDALLPEMLKARDDVRKQEEDLAPSEEAK